MTYTYEYPHPAVATDIVIFSIRNGRLHVLLIKRKDSPFRGKWALPGGFLKMEESLDECAKRELREETGVDQAYLEQLYTFGAPRRDPRERVISVSYFALISSDKLELRASTDAADAEWFPIESVPALAFDHSDILKTARERLINKISYSTIAFQFLPRDFTLTELQSIYEEIQGEDLDKRNFRKWALTIKGLKETGKKRLHGAHRPAKLYRLLNASRVGDLN